MMNINEAEVKGFGYWEDKGRFQSDYDRLYDTYVPNSGKSTDMPFGEALRCVSNIAHDWYNNGWGNNMSYEFDFLDSSISNKLSKLGKNVLTSLQDLWDTEIGPSFLDKSDPYWDDDEEAYENFYVGDFTSKERVQINKWLNFLIDDIILAMLKDNK